jgi:hypothetical protein
MVDGDSQEEDEWGETESDEEGIPGTTSQKVIMDLIEK